MASGMKYRAEEYEALTGNIPSKEFSSDDFVWEIMDTAKYHIPGFKRVTLVHKIREVRALTGFTRLNPPGSTELGRAFPVSFLQRNLILLVSGLRGERGRNFYRV